MAQTSLLQLYTQFRSGFRDIAIIEFGLGAKAEDACIKRLEVGLLVKILSLACGFKCPMASLGGSPMLLGVFVVVMALSLSAGVLP